jgi:hypothetical protein
MLASTINVQDSVIKAGNTRQQQTPQEARNISTPSLGFVPAGKLLHTISNS